MKPTTKLLICQVIITLTSGALLYVWRSADHALAALYGGFSAVILSLMLLAMIEMLSKKLGRNEKVNKGMWMLLVIPRLIVAAVFLVCGISLLHLYPIPMITAFALVYLTYWMGWKFSKE